MCHLVLLMPVFGLAVFFLLPLPYAAAIYLLILIATALLYRAVVKAMCRRVVTGTEAMLGASASVRRVDPGRMVVCSAGRAVDRAARRVHRGELHSRGSRWSLLTSEATGWSWVPPLGHLQSERAPNASPRPGEAPIGRHHGRATNSLTMSSHRSVSDSIVRPAASMFLRVSRSMLPPIIGRTRGFRAFIV